MMAPCSPSATSWVNTTSVSTKPASASPSRYSERDKHRRCTRCRSRAHDELDIDDCQYEGILALMTSPTALPLTDVACCAPLTREPLSAGSAAALAQTLKAIADPTRLR